MPVQFSSTEAFLRDLSQICYTSNGLYYFWPAFESLNLYCFFQLRKIDKNQTNPKTKQN